MLCNNVCFGVVLFVFWVLSMLVVLLVWGVGVLLVLLFLVIVVLS